MRMRGVCLLVLIAWTAGARAQEADYGEDRIAPSRVPAAYRKTAEAEAPGARFTHVYRNNEKQFRFVGRGENGRTHSIRIDREGKLISRSVYVDVPAARLPRIVSESLRSAIAKDPELAGFQPARISLVDRFDALKGEASKYYEAFGHTPKSLHPRIEIEPGGKLIQVSKSFIPGTDDYTKRRPLAAREIPPQVLQGFATATGGARPTLVLRVTTKATPEPTFELFGKREDGSGVEVWIHPNGVPYVALLSAPLRDVPAAALAAVKREAATDPRLKTFQPVEAWRVKLLALDEEKWSLYGDGADGDPLDVRVDAGGIVTVSGDSREILREEAGLAVGAGRRPAAANADGFAVIAARYGVDHHWVDVTEEVRQAALAGRKTFVAEALPDAAFGRHKTIVLLYSSRGVIGMSQALDDKPLPLEAKDGDSTTSEVPATGFAVLAARFLYEDQWKDVTDVMRGKVENGRLNVKPAVEMLPDPAPDAPKALGVAYVNNGKIGLYVQSQWRFTSLPPEAPPVNSGELLAKSLEFPKAVSTAAFMPDGRNVVIGVEDGSVRLVDASSGRELRRFDGHGAGRVGMAVSGDGKWIASGGGDGVVRVWDVKAEKERSVARGHSAPIHRVALSPNGRFVASISQDKTARLWDAATGDAVGALTGHTDFIDGIAFSPDGKRIATSSWDGSVRIWDVATRKETRKTQIATGKCGDVAWFRNGRDLVFGSDDLNLRLWTPTAGTDAQATDAGAECGWAVAPMPDGRRAWASDKVAASLWDLKTGRVVLRLERHVNRVTGLAVSPNGKLIATSGSDQTLKLWKLPDLGP